MRGVLTKTWLKKLKLLMNHDIDIDVYTSIIYHELKKIYLIQCCNTYVLVNIFKRFDRGYYQLSHTF